MKVIAGFTLVLMLTAGGALASTMVRVGQYQSITIKSTKLHKSLNTSEVEKFVCKQVNLSQNFAQMLDLMQNYDGRESKSVGDISMMGFSGSIDGKPATIELFTDTGTNVLMYVWANGKPMMGCKI